MPSQDLRLTAADQARLSEAIGALLSPLDYADVDTWRAAVNARIKPLFGAEIASFVLPLGGRAHAFTEDLPSAAPRYISSLDPFARWTGGYERMRRFGAITRRELWGPYFGAFKRSAYWNEFLRPARAFDSVTVTVGVSERSGLDGMAQLILNRDSPKAPPFGAREVALGRLVLPALRAGALTWLRLGERRCALAVEVDAIGVPLFLLDAEGRELHRNAALRGALAMEPDADAVAELARRLATSAGRLGTPGLVDVGGGTEQIAEGVVRTRGGGYRLRASRVGGAVTGHDEAVVVTVEREGGAGLPAEEALRDRWGLTRQQARVALLLAERRTNQEVAEALGVSPHTARHHVEAVLEKLGLRDRLRVRDRLLGG